MPPVLQSRTPLSPLSDQVNTRFHSPQQRAKQPHIAREPKLCPHRWSKDERRALSVTSWAAAASPTNAYSVARMREIARRSLESALVLVWVGPRVGLGKQGISRAR